MVTIMKAQRCPPSVPFIIRPTPTANDALFILFSEYDHYCSYYSYQGSQSTSRTMPASIFCEGVPASILVKECQPASIPVRHCGQRNVDQFPRRRGCSCQRSGLIPEPRGAPRTGSTMTRTWLRKPSSSPARSSIEPSMPRLRVRTPNVKLSVDRGLPRFAHEMLPIFTLM